MKKFFSAIAVVLMMSSCSTVYKTASTEVVTDNIKSVVVADLDVSPQKITYTYIPDRKVKKGGWRNCLNAAISEALKQNGDADILLETQSAIITHEGLFGRSIRSITVSGYPARYKNFQSLDKDAVKDILTQKLYISK